MNASLFDKTIDQAFDDFNREHPEVYSELVRLARQLKSRGHKRYGIGSLFEVIRWHRALQSRDEAGFKVNNNFRSRYARLIMQRESDLAGFFETRELRAA